MAQVTPAPLGVTIQAEKDAAVVILLRFRCRQGDEQEAANVGWRLGDR
jgi:hypothetical protein